jgi:hypothetical protein
MVNQVCGGVDVMTEFENAIKIINEVVETCRSWSQCYACPYWDKDKGECKVHMTANVENTPDMW